MTDKDTIDAVRESFSSTRLATPAEEVMNRGQSLRRRRQSFTGGIAAVAAVAITVTVLASGLVGGQGTVREAGGNQGNRAQLTAWTVTREPNQIFKIKFRQLADLAGLNAALRADGAATIVSFAGTRPLNCKEWRGSPVPKVVFNTPNNSGTTRGTVLILHLRAMPARAMLWVQIIRYGYQGVTNSEHHFPKGSFASVAEFFYKATRACAHTSWAPDGS
jgi:hypothetical protein